MHPICLRRTELSVICILSETGIFVKRKVKSPYPSPYRIVYLSNAGRGDIELCATMALGIPLLTSFAISGSGLTNRGWPLPGNLCLMLRAPGLRRPSSGRLARKVITGSGASGSP